MMAARLWRFLQRKLSGWRELFLPGALIIGLVCLVRLSGLLQTQEWMVLDTFSRHCPIRPLPQRIMIITIDEGDYQTTGEYPISDQILAQALITLQQYQPRVIGLDVFRDPPMQSGESILGQVMQSMPNVVAVEVALNQNENLNIAAPEAFPPDQIGFADLIEDADGKLRRVILAAEGQNGATKYSLALQLSRKYLEGENVFLSHGQPASAPIRFGKSTLPKFRSNSGGYVRADARGNQMLIHFCALQEPYETISLNELLAENIDPNQLRDRIVIIGTITNSVRDSFITSAVRETLHTKRISAPPTPTHLIYGVEIHAQATKQILSLVLDSPCILTTWPEIGEYLWIISWGLIGITISVVLQSPWKSVVSLAIATLILLAIGYGFLNLNWWIPVTPTALALCSAGLITAFFDRDIRSELEQRRNTVERTYEAVHNGPLQHLAAILRSSDEQKLSPEQLYQRLQELNTELRSIFDHMMRQDTITRRDTLYLTDNTILHLEQPLAELLQQVYDHVLAQPLSGFSQVQTFITPDFSSLNQSRFRLDQKRDLCLFLQEALLNIGKHARNATRIDVICTTNQRHHYLQIVDNGMGTPLSTTVPPGQGTHQAITLAQRLRGQFQRRPNSPHGIICELIWPI